MNKLQTVENVPTVPSGAITPLEMLSAAVARGADIEIIERLMALYERWERNQARKAFGKAVAAAKAEIKPIIKNRKGHNGKYEDLAAIADVVDPILSSHGLHYRYGSAQDEKKITITCILEHDDGHWEGTPLSGPADTSGNKNAIQAIGSTATYLERYTLKLALGLSAAADDDGRASGESTEPISAEQLEQIRTLIAEHGKDITKFCTFMKVERLEAIPAAKFDDAVTAIKYKRPDAKQ